MIQQKKRRPTFTGKPTQLNQIIKQSIYGTNMIHMILKSQRVNFEILKTQRKKNHKYVY